MPLAVTGIDHVQIAVPEAKEPECLVFYREVFGFSEIAKPKHLRGRGGAWFQIGSLQLHVGVDSQPSPESKRHICFSSLAFARAKDEIITLWDLYGRRECGGRPLPFFHPRSHR